MDRREFLKSALTIAAFASLSKLSAGVPDSAVPAAKVTRRRYKNSDLTLPLLGFGLMRLPRNRAGKIDMVQAEKMVAAAMAGGCNYFDTAYMYHGGESEKFVGEILSKYPRESYMLTSKMPMTMLKSEAQVAEIFNEQLRRTKAGYFDFYFLHWLNGAHWERAKKFKVLEFMKAMQAAGKIRRIGFSFHGSNDALREIAAAYDWDLAQISLNYLDWEVDQVDQQYRILTERGIPVAVMSPLKGGQLATLTPQAQAVFKKAAPEQSVASWGLRYAASLPNVAVVLSGMSNMAQLEDNIRTFAPFKALNDAERKVIAEALEVYRRSGAVPCTACRYCLPCPAGVDIPRNLKIYNQFNANPRRRGSLKAMNYNSMGEDERASACVKCGVCLRKCPQGINIPELMETVAGEFA